jgi:hypothetical protein
VAIQWALKALHHIKNTLASLIVFTSPGIFYLINTSKKKYFHFLFMLLILMNIFILLITYSRASILSLTVTLIFYTLLKNIFFLRYILIGFLILGFLYFILSKFNNSIKSLALKNSNNIFKRRSELWDASFKAAMLGGVIGLGYGISSP